ncbi:cupin domain-containing protein [uncultured Ramlibacter sp.]|mgnify:CR=1 FL=1|uniref:JmjC domain-containing protein n=1 Tax=uncultured Ramlibacter sp. TaxID=260755 RepID=UPI0026284664|nr:cupin domain-containing protein [uncultured Ramlibacter sp.]
MDTSQALPLLGGLTADQFMQRHWQKKPLLVRGAVPGMAPLLERGDLFALAGQEAVESRLVSQSAKGWQMRSGPFARRSLPPLGRPGWTLLVQGMDLHHAGVHGLLQQFRFVPEARLDDLMISYASDGGGVGPHFDSYDVFLLQAQGRRRWRIGRQRDFTLQEGVPLKILANFEPEQEYLLEPGDMLYLPPRYAHDGIAEGECQTYSIGFRAPGRGELARELLQRLAEDADELAGGDLYRDKGQSATATPGAIPAALQDFAREALQAALRDADALARGLGEYLTEPKANVWFDAGRAPARLRSLALDRRTRMLYDQRHVFINGESWRAAGRDATLLRALADRRQLDASELARASPQAQDLLASWCEAGWAHEGGGDGR